MAMKPPSKPVIKPNMISGGKPTGGNAPVQARPTIKPNMISKAPAGTRSGVGRLANNKRNPRIRQLIP